MKLLRLKFPTYFHFFFEDKLKKGEKGNERKERKEKNKSKRPSTYYISFNQTLRGTTPGIVRLQHSFQRNPALIIQASEPITPYSIQHFS